MESGNQQERPLGLEFVAGLAVGEGSFFLTVRSATEMKGVKIEPRFEMFMDDKESMLVAAEILQNAGLPVYLHEVRDSLKLVCAGIKRTDRYIEALLPYLTGNKRKAAEIVKEYIDLRLSKSRRDPYGDKEIEIVQRLRSFQSRGHGPKRRVVSPETIRNASAT